MSKNLRVKTSKFIDETTRVSFKFNSKNYYGYKGDTLASALIANGIHLVGRSFKYHRPRGIMTAGSEEPNAIVQLNNNSALSEPNVRATEVEIYDGLEASSQNCWPSVNFDIGGINNFLSPLLPAGFYYKTFMWPASFWEKYEYFIRKSAGLGKSPAAPDPDIYDHKYIHCDVLVIGGGISGIMAAKTAAQNGLNTLLVEEKPNLGGTTIYQNSEQHKINNQTSSIWLEKEIANLESLDNLEIKTRTSVAAFHGYNFLLARENLTDHLPIKDRTNKVRQRLLKIRAKKVITATGSLERPLVFNNNDRPGSVIIGFLGLALIVFWDSFLAKKGKIFRVLQGAIVAVLLGTIIKLIFDNYPNLAVKDIHLVSIPVADNLNDLLNFLTFPDFSAITNPKVLTIAFTIALIASLETLLSVEATDKLDPDKHVTPTNRELFAQGTGNILSGLIGGLPLTQVIVRSSANIQSNAKSKLSSIIHGLLLLLAVLDILE